MPIPDSVSGPKFPAELHRPGLQPVFFALFNQRHERPDPLESWLVRSGSEDNFSDDGKSVINGTEQAVYTTGAW
ncbi:hypothetical protein EOT10_37960 [Streptomyces antnestii]|uniref:Uncharacterized protein n=1 Tax=Streptomyces antnestii TaxID=2494256 RepID=A0A437P0Z4_9ACTN|nr:hypothetical protein [Streptomyces sp. San01]RVU15895.1 hypothetical protein EOT10_37960 [Streptomyces sp. San01]